VLDTTRFGYTGPVAVEIGWPRGVLVTWPGESTQLGAPTRTWLARFDCVSKP
jgi:hypothetical protein